MVGGAGLIGLGLHFIPGVADQAPIVGGLAGIATGVALGHGRPAWRLVPAVVAGAALVVLAHRDPAMSLVAPVLAALSIAFGVGLAVGVRGVRGVIAVAMGALVPLLAMWAALRIGHAQELHAWPAWLVAALASTAMGMVGVLAMLPRHLVFSTDPVAAALRRLPAKLPAEVTELCDRSVAVWTAAKRDLADEPGLQLVRDGVVNALEVAARTTEPGVAGAGDSELATRLADLDTRIAAASDAEVKAQYEAARAALADQQRYRERIRTGRDRLVARMHSHVAALEKFHLAATTLPAARAATTTTQLEELSHELASSGEALAELELA